VQKKVFHWIISGLNYNMKLLLLLIFGFCYLWCIVAEPSAKFGRLSGDELYWKESFEKLSIRDFIFFIDAQNPYLSLVPRTLFALGNLDFVTELVMGFELNHAVVHLSTVAIGLICLTLPMLKGVQARTDLTPTDGLLLSVISIVMLRSDLLFIFNLGYLFAPLLLFLFIQVLPTVPGNLNRMSLNKIDFTFAFLSHFLIFVLLLNKGILAAIFLLLSIFIQLYLIQQSFSQIAFSPRLLGIQAACLLHVFLSESERAVNGYAFTNVLNAIIGIVFFVGASIFPFSNYLDSSFRSLNLDYLTGINKIVVLFSGLVVFWYIFNRINVLKTLGFPNGSLRYLLISLIIPLNIIIVNMSQYSSWYLGGWFFTANESLMSRHLILSQLTFYYLLIKIMSVAGKKSLILESHRRRKFTDLAISYFQRKEIVFFLICGQYILAEILHKVF